MTEIPKYSGKVTLDKLSHLDKKAWEGKSAEESCVYNFERENLKYDFLWSPSPGSRRLFVMFAGDAMRKNNDPPVFQRWSWAKHFPGHCLFFSDPSLYIDDSLGLAWYGGTQDVDVLEVISKTIRGFLDHLGLSEKDLYAYGSSGGGFAALRLLHFMPDAAAIAINPQTSVFKYEPTRVKRYLHHCFGGRSIDEGVRDFSDRLDLLSNVERLKGKRIAIIQNVVDTHHYEDHFKPLCDKLGAGHNHDPDDILLRRILFSHEGGHTKAETQEVFSEIIGRVERGTF